MLAVGVQLQGREQRAASQQQHAPLALQVLDNQKVNVLVLHACLLLVGDSAGRCLVAQVRGAPHTRRCCSCSLRHAQDHHKPALLLLFLWLRCQSHHQTV